MENKKTKQKVVKLKEKLFKPSKTEDFGIELIPYNAENILSIGISTGGSAEIRMAKNYRGAKIIATTLDKNGMDFAKKVIAKYGVSKQIRVKLEDVRNVMPYQNDEFDIVYARLVLHYLSADELDSTLEEIYRILKPGGLFYLVMHDKNDKYIKKNKIDYDPETNLTTFSLPTKLITKRQFFSDAEIVDILINHNFKIAEFKHWKERLYTDFERTKEYKRKSKLISFVAYKPNKPEIVPDWD